MENLLVVVAISTSANLVTTVVGLVTLFAKVQKAGEWKGWAETKIKSNCGRINYQGKKIDNMESRLSTHEGEAHQ